MCCILLGLCYMTFCTIQFSSQEGNFSVVKRQSYKLDLTELCNVRDAECWGLKESISSLQLEADTGNGHWEKTKQNRTRLRCGAKMGFLFPFLPSVAGKTFVLDRLCLQSAVFLLSSWKTVAQCTLVRGHLQPSIADLPSGKEWAKDIRLSAQITENLLLLLEASG